jgi:hypothetical protein
MLISPSFTVNLQSREGFKQELPNLRPSGSCRLWFRRRCISDPTHSPQWWELRKEKTNQHVVTLTFLLDPTVVLADRTKNPHPWIHVDQGKNLKLYAVNVGFWCHTESLGIY